MPPRDLSTLRLDPNDLKTLQALLNQHVPNLKVWAFGSRVTGGCHTCSDLDIVLIDTDDDAEWLPRYNSFNALIEAIQFSSIAILIDMHLWSRLEDTFKARIVAAYIPL